MTDVTTPAEALVVVALGLVLTSLIIGLMEWRDRRREK